MAGGRPVLARLQRVALGKDTDLHGDIRWPERAGASWTVTASGRSLDASDAFNRKAVSESKPTDDSQGPPWQVQAHFDRVMLGNGRAVGGIDVRAASDGSIITQARLNGRTSANGGFGLTIQKAPGGRRLTGTADDAGALLRVLDIASDLKNGRMTLSGTYDDSRSDHRLSGTAEMTGFRVHNVPAMTRLLQAMTLYGLVQLVQGPGLAFDRLIAPYRLTGDVLELTDARAFSASLGMTAKGTLDMAHERVDLQGTLVPAYFFNSLLGGIPLVGRLFSPETGGGVFAATYSVQGGFNDPKVSTNPLTGLTPGFLRGLFGM
jgi:AsmA-like C-terminal region